MLQPVLKHVSVTNDLLQVEFTTSIGPSVNCGGQRVDKLLHTTTIRNPSWGVRLRRVTIHYEIDTKGVSLCSDLLANTCSESGEALILQIPAVPQEYWKGQAKHVNVRSCVPTPFASSDYNVSYTVKAELDSRDKAGDADRPITIVSNMYVRVA